MRLIIIVRNGVELNNVNNRSKTDTHTPVPDQSRRQIGQDRPNNATVRHYNRPAKLIGQEAADDLTHHVPIAERAHHLAQFIIVPLELVPDEDFTNLFLEFKFPSSNLTPRATPNEPSKPVWCRQRPGRTSS